MLFLAVTVTVEVVYVVMVSVVEPCVLVMHVGTTVVVV